MRNSRTGKLVENVYMSFRSPSTAEEQALVKRWVVWNLGGPGMRRYLRLLGVNPLGERSDRAIFEAGLARDAREISDDNLYSLLELDWRARLTAAWLIALDRRTHFRPALGELLPASEVAHAGKGYCLALARFGQLEDAEILVAYLDYYLPRTECPYDQDWAIGALLTLDHELGTAHAAQFLGSDGLWHRSAFAATDPTSCKATLARLCVRAERIMERHI